ncbi:NADPH-dependent 2,4-dienoyl-CoA reductase/sulfur reductase-like enzyme/protein-tyrosine-phosphatase/rhodanese-related sulfurtransferase [Promicromonospora iranensis]|uniref:NADPH-dependent 2,4-dienoyl-CoA reductase/sulfur reductase-like enzyme/protein-tyrosine-phosphatase/rhodanese-related sulfurtransferase n=1 Tax=Promicromonospora iranensis TaxID=1105144 RepID=A0ABU2CQ00_9MICO|nr:NADPH-dependent 2,4-dienoyl-CoA reductase/sulfur reductase-like enzyme/protein-tyrosine-phosphatase/rhodanese-related sulfurtransferase [Promicromonospora iranensis]
MTATRPPDAPLKIVIVGSVAAGTSAAAKARRNTETARITVYERDHDISYSGCGLPYFVGGEVADIDDLTPRDPAWFKARYDVDVRTGHEVVAVDTAARTVTVRDLATGRTFVDTYDELVLATGVRAVVPPIPGAGSTGVFSVRTPTDARAIRAWIEDSESRGRPVRHAVVVGAGYIGLEMTEQLTARGLAVTVVEAADHTMPRMDADMSARVDAEVRRHVRERGGDLLLSTKVTGITADDGGVTGVGVAREQAAEHLDAELVIVSVGVRPHVNLAEQAGVELGPTGAIAVDRRMRTNVEHVWAVGDVAESFHVITGEPVWVPLGSTANKMGRIAGDAMTGGPLEHRGILGTSIVRVFDLGVAQTGFTETQARAAGYDVEVLHNIKPDRPEYLGGTPLVIKAVADRATGRLLGAQAIGASGADKRIDVLATAITYGADVADLFHLDLAYSPTYATTKDPVHYTGMALTNAVHGQAPLVTPAELDRRRSDGERIQVVDVRSAKDRARSSVPDSVHIPLAELRQRAGELDPALPTLTYCNKGVTGNAGQNVLRNLGFTDVANLSGGNQGYQQHRQHTPRATPETPVPETSTPRKPSALFVCVHNAGRSQMAAGFLRALSGGAVEVRSAGSMPADQINPVAVEAMLEVGIDIRDETPKILTDDAVEASDAVITMGCGDACPFYPGKNYQDWELDDPAGQGIEAIRPIRDEIERRVRGLLAELGVQPVA